MAKKVTATSKLLLEFMKGLTDTTLDLAEGFLLSMGSAKTMARNLHLSDKNYHSIIQGLKRNGFIKRINENQFLITPKAVGKAVIIKAQEENTRAKAEKWDGRWRLIFFDIPNDKNRERGIFRSHLKRMGFLGIQKSVFVAPFADFDGLSRVRSSLGIDKYVTFLIARSPHTDDDSALIEKFGLKLT